MARSFMGRPVELLAPAGSLRILEDLIDSGADSFYVGGKILNMRLHRADLNFSEEDLVKASGLCRERGKALYLTVNNLLGADDLAQLDPFLTFLAEKVHPRAIILQDPAVAQRVRALGLDLPLHASVMFNIHNIAGAAALKALGFERAIVSREISLAEARRIKEATGLQTEYFVHGDMCIAHGSQCLYSSLVFGKSSNRGQCMKPCRWGFSARFEGREYEAAFPLAVKDINLRAHVPELLAAGIDSLKIEGRMRDSAYLSVIVDAYARTLDRYIADPGHFDPSLDEDVLEANRKRDFSTAYALGRPGRSYLNVRWEGTGKFYSTGKVFSSPLAEPDIDQKRLGDLREKLLTSAREGKPLRPSSPQTQLAVRVASLDQASLALESGADAVILSGEARQGSPDFGKGELQALRAGHPGKVLALQLPRMMDDADCQFWTKRLLDLQAAFDELYVGHLGAAEALGLGQGRQAFRLVGDSSLNIYNALTASFWHERGLDLLSASLELGLKDFLALLEADRNLEITVHGRPTAMYMENDSYENALAGNSRPIAQPDPFPDSILRLVDHAGEAHPVLKDQHGRCHLLPTKSLCLIDLVPALARLSVARLRIEAALMDQAQLGAVVKAYRGTLDSGKPQPPPSDSLGFSLGGLAFD